MTEPAQSSEARASPLKAALRQARIDAADRTSVVVDLKDAELARLEILNDALDPVFADVPATVDLFDRGISQGEPPRLWIDMLAHVVMGPDKRVYRFLQDTRHGRRVLVESPKVEDIATAVAQYVARRLIERDRALAGDTTPVEVQAPATAPARTTNRRWGFGVGLFLLGVLCGAVALAIAAWFIDPLIY